MNNRSSLSRVILSALTALSISVPSANAQGLGGDLADFWDRTGGGINYTRPQAYEGQRAGFVTLGSLYVRSAPRNTSLANIQLPSIRAGCGGIDIFGGSFSFLSAEELIALMENIMANAAGFAFELALESMSPAVQDTVAKLRDLAQQVNSMNINSCEAGAALVGSVWPQHDAASQLVCQTVGTMNGIVADRARSRHSCGAGGQNKDITDDAADELADQVPVNVNYAWKASRKNALLVSDDSLAEFFMTLTGTVIVIGAEDDDTPSTHVNHPPRAFSSQMIRALTEGGTIEILRCDSDPEDRCLEPTWQDVTITQDTALFARVRDILNGINDSLADDDDLPAGAEGLIGMTSIPVYETLKVARQYKYEFVGDEIALMAELVAIDFAMLYTREALEEMMRLAGNTEGLGDQLSDYRQQVQDSYSNFSAMRREAAEKYADAVATLTRLQQISGYLAGESAGWLASNVVSN